jgi:hypothetical protein
MPEKPIDQRRNQCGSKKTPLRQMKTKTQPTKICGM